MKTRPVVMVLVVVGVIAAPLVAEAPPQKPGQWQIRTQIEMPGVAMEIPAVTQSVCFTEEDLKDPKGAIPKDANSDCEISDYEVDGNKVTWTMECPSQDLKGSGEITFSEDGTSYEGAMKMSMGGQQMSTKYTATYQGPCTKE